MILPLLLVLSQAPAIQEPDRVVYLKHQQLDLTGADIAGETKAPVGTLILPKPSTAFQNLIRVRGDFAAELRASVDGL